ncbi:hypothetical protein AAFF_G00207680 [Aldrovandia affinis]|uniref:Uncharacterized protein n=1 Tax=Aldrovandia affinis TaxID=143900 RepID=A0AAD7RHM0_9TELE|nr:hypothetical protein AAFF_G00207680 [Aldrovandia affinis]
MTPSSTRSSLSLWGDRLAKILIYVHGIKRAGSKGQPAAFLRSPGPPCKSRAMGEIYDGEMLPYADRRFFIGGLRTTLLPFSRRWGHPRAAGPSQGRAEERGERHGHRGP